MLSSQLVSSLKLAEGLRLIAYKDTNGFWTIGYGHLLALGKDWAGYTISADYANTLLILDANKATADALSLPEWASLDTPARRDAMIELIYNLGLGNWLKFTRTRGAISAGQWQSVHDGLLQSLWATQVHSRATKLANQMLTGTYSPLSGLL